MGQVNASSRRVSKLSVCVFFLFFSCVVLRLFLVVVVLILLPAAITITMKQGNEPTTQVTWRTWLLLTLITAVIVLEAAVRHFKRVDIAWAQLALCFLGFLIVLDDFLGSIVMRHVITPFAQWLGKAPSPPPLPSPPQEKQEVVEETKDPKQQRRRSTRLRDNPTKSKNE